MLEAAQRLARIGSWRVDTATGTVQLSPEMLRILGFDLWVSPLLSLSVASGASGNVTIPVAIRADQLLGDPVGVGKPQPQVGVVVPEIVQVRARPPPRGGEVELRPGARVGHSA